jgi:photosystem II stability/assembly factor-like uncharacterized protein
VIPFIGRRPSPRVGVASVALALLLPWATLLAQAVPQSAYAAMRWRMIGPFRGGRALAVAGVPGNPSTFYFGSVDGGVWKTDNAGVTWTPLFDDQPISSIGAIALAPSDPAIIYVGTGEADMRSDITFGAGVYKSTDGGAHWTSLGLADTRQIGKILVDPRDPAVVWVAVLGHAYGPNAQRGVFRSTNGGASWEKVLYKGPDVGAIDLAFDPHDPGVVYAALWQTRRRPWSQYPPDEGLGSAIYKTTDAGATWTELSGHGLPQPPLGRVGLAVAPHGRVYVLAPGANEDAGLYRSDDGGATWRLMSSDANVTTRGWYFGQVFVDPTNPDVVYAPNRSIMRSRDGGKTFVAIKGSPGGDDYHDLWIDPRDPTHLIFGSDQGVGVSLDDGRTWSGWFNQPTAQLYHVITDHRFPYLVYGAQQDAGTASVASRSDYGSITFREFLPVGAGESGYIAPDPLDSNIVYGGDTYGGLRRFDRRTGQAQDITPWPLGAFGQSIARRKYRFTWTSPLVFDPLDGHTLYYGAQLLLRTRDGGLRWDEISPDLTGVKPQAATDTGPVTVANAAARGWGVIYTIAPSPRSGGMIWIGTDDGLIQLTTDGGTHWRNVTPPALAPWSKISLIEASPHDAAEAYAAVDRHRLDDTAPYIYRTRDAGRTWTKITDGIAPAAYVHVVRADSVRAGLLYAGTELGAYVSFDDGDHWQSLQRNLPVVSIRDLAVHDNDLIAATHGRAFWILDDLTPLQQLTVGALRDPLLFRPKRAFRLRRSVSNDTPLPPEFPQGENPPAGAIIDYFLAAPAAGPVTMEITDAAGNPVRRFLSSDTVPPPGAPAYFESAWLPRRERLQATAGQHRFVWDLRYPLPPLEEYDYTIAAVAGQGTVEAPLGPLVLPGRYAVALTVGGRTLTQPLDVVLDPRVTVTDAALRAQLGLALDVWNAMGAALALARTARSTARQLDALPAERLDAVTTDAARALQARIERLVEALEAGNLAELEDAITSADREPTAQARAAFAELRARLSRRHAEWDALTRELGQLNARLAQQRVAAIVPVAVVPERVVVPANLGGRP